LFSGKPPRISLPGGAHLGEWLTFSEFWSFQNIIPEPEQLLVKRCLAKQSGGRATAFDIGANVGGFTCLIASLGHTVHSFEPIPETFCRLKNNVKYNGLLDHAHLNRLAVGKEPGLVTFHIEDDSPATNRMAMPGEQLRGKATSIQVVAAIDLDGYCQSQGVEFIDFLKVDVEGMEPYVLQGAKTLLKEQKIAAILIEICPVNLRAVGLSPADLYREFEIARYSPHALNDNGQPGAKLSLAEIEAMSLANVVLLPDA
jgi:FkbM family methyltransferase